MKKNIIFLAMALLLLGCSKTPIASFTYEKSSLFSKVTVYFYNHTTGAAYYEWNFGDGGVSTDRDPQHSYSETGTYTVTLKAYNKNSSKFDTYSEKITISINGEDPGDGESTPVANFNISGSNQYAPAEVSFTNLSQNASSYSWDFGDGSYSSSKNPTHTYSSPGSYYVTLQAINNVGSNYMSKQVTVKNNPTKWNLTKFTLTAYPLTDNGDNWDYTDAGPDIFFQILQGNTVIYTSSTKDNVQTGSLPLVWNVSGVSLDVNTQYTVKYYDEDGVADPNDLMGQMTFYPNIMDFNSSSWSWISGSWEGSWNYTWN